MKFFFEIHDAAGIIEDEEGFEASSVEVACRYCLDMVRRLMESELEAGLNLDVLWIEVFDDSRVRVAMLPVDDAKALGKGSCS